MRKKYVVELTKEERQYLSAPLPSDGAGPGNLVAASASANPPPRLPWPTRLPTPSGLPLGQLCAGVQRDPPSTPRPSPPSLCLCLHPCSQRPTTNEKGAGTAFSRSRAAVRSPPGRSHGPHGPSPLAPSPRCLLAGDVFFPLPPSWRRRSLAPPLLPR